MKQLVIINKRTLKRRGADEDKIQQYNSNPKLKTVKNDKEFLSDFVVRFSEISNTCEHKAVEKENNIQRLYCKFHANGTEKTKCNIGNCPKIKR